MAQHLVFVASMFCSCFWAGYFSAAEMQWEQRRRLITALGSGLFFGGVAIFLGRYSEEARLFFLLLFPVMVFLSITDLYTNEMCIDVSVLPVFVTILAGIAVWKEVGVVGIGVAFVYSLVWYSTKYIAKKETISFADLPVLWLVGVNGVGALFFTLATLIIPSLAYMLSRQKYIPLVPYLTIGLVGYYIYRSVILAIPSMP